MSSHLLLNIVSFKQIQFNHLFVLESKKQIRSYHELKLRTKNKKKKVFKDVKKKPIVKHQFAFHVAQSIKESPVIKYGLGSLISWCQKVSCMLPKDKHHPESYSAVNTVRSNNDPPGKTSTLVQQYHGCHGSKQPLSEWI